jgi:hypothetical protein
MGIRVYGSSGDAIIEVGGGVRKGGDHESGHHNIGYCPLHMGKCMELEKIDPVRAR